MVQYVEKHADNAPPSMATGYTPAVSEFNFKPPLNPPLSLCPCRQCTAPLTMGQLDTPLLCLNLLSTPLLKLFVSLCPCIQY